jgi:hypothetical protein
LNTDPAGRGLADVGDHPAPYPGRLLAARRDAHEVAVAVDLSNIGAGLRRHDSFPLRPGEPVVADAEDVRLRRETPERDHNERL